MFVCSVMSDSLRPHGLQSTRLLLSMGFPRQEYLSRLPFSPLGDLLIPGLEPTSFQSLALAGRFFTTLPPGKPLANCRDKKVFRIVRSTGQQGSHLSRCLPAEGWREQGRSGQGAWEGPSQELRGSWVPLHCGVQRAPFCAFLPPVWRPYHRMPCLNQECSTSRPHRSWKLDDVDSWLLHHQPIRRHPWADHTPWNSLPHPVFKNLFLEAIGEFGFFKH